MSYISTFSHCCWVHKDFTDAYDVLWAYPLYLLTFHFLPIPFVGLSSPVVLFYFHVIHTRTHTLNNTFSIRDSSVYVIKLGYMMKNT